MYLGVAGVYKSYGAAGLVTDAFRSGDTGFLVFSLAAWTHFFDGWLARRRDGVAPLGVFMDLTAGKVQLIPCTLLK